jgi:hypothetical protein
MSVPENQAVAADVVSYTGNARTSSRSCRKTGSMSFRPPRRTRRCSPSRMPGGGSRTPRRSRPAGRSSSSACDRPAAGAHLRVSPGIPRLDARPGGSCRRRCPIEPRDRPSARAGTIRAKTWGSGQRPRKDPVGPPRSGQARDGAKGRHSDHPAEDRGLGRANTRSSPTRSGRARGWSQGAAPGSSSRRPGLAARRRARAYPGVAA